MFKNFRDKIVFSGLTVLTVGVALLVFTFVSAYGFLTHSLSIIASEDLMLTFGEALAPLVATCIRVMYLGVMGWIGSLLTIRGVTMIAHAPKTQEEAPRQKVVAKSIPKKAKAEQPKEESKPKKELKPKEKSKPPEPEVIVRPPAPAQHPQQPQEQKQESIHPQQQSSS